ncbi:MAG: DUF928 domain-containing protein [Nodosilinea sp.]
MTQVLTMKNRSWLAQLIGLGSAVSLLVGGIPAGLADYTPGPRDPIRGSNTGGGVQAYNPPADSQRPRGDHSGGGVRGCGDDMAALAPRLNAIGQTASIHPTFVWYSFSGGAEFLEVQLYKYGADNVLEKVLIREIGTNQAGYMAYTLPDTDPGLQVGETYFWQVVMYCDQNLQEVGKWVSADLEVVAAPGELTASGLQDDPLQLAQRYGQAGLWYDAMALVYDASTPQARAFRSTLLLNLADLEEEPTAEAPTLSDQLRQIAAMQG